MYRAQDDTISCRFFFDDASFVGLGRVASMQPCAVPCLARKCRPTSCARDKANLEGSILWLVLISSELALPLPSKKIDPPETNGHSEMPAPPCSLLTLTRSADHIES